jgi:DNA invertase Pin-like site-specific DNA recombinase
MSKFNYSTELCEQLDQLDEKLVEVIKLVKTLEKRVVQLESIAKERGLLEKNHTGATGDESCILM